MGAITTMFSKIATWTAYQLGTPLAFILACASTILWAATGPIFAYSDTWQLVINTGTTVLTFLAVFLIQNTQNRDSAAIHVKLDELIRVAKGARNELMALENRADTDIAAARTTQQNNPLENME